MATMTEWLLLLLGVVLTVGNCLRGGGVLARRPRPAHRGACSTPVEKGARSVLYLHRQLSTQLSACQLGITLTTLILGFTQPVRRCPAHRAAEQFRPQRRSRRVDGLGAGHGHRDAVLDDRRRDGAQDARHLLPLVTAKISAAPVRWFGISMKPMIALLNGVANRTPCALGIEPQEELSAACSPAELVSLIRSSAEAGTPGRGHREAGHGILGFTDQTAADAYDAALAGTSIDRGDRG